ncbi:hypothetical protein J8L98_24055 [Pseudoalteromonas sp. MMG013]|uniref:hypothetical protein n=1 Tax=Pseudoalteromonas sp. MMG013 TaxID=2822687 RepID=UPI001B39330C|nr:hypothetical protein [Pseudoalteromonas sp. MMG013]MBQ4864763.1 hypothetical protein [Pseudoalteromonas sp. MMG013]
MDKVSFLKHVSQLGIDKSSFSLNGPINERYCLKSSGFGWEVFYAERDHKNALVTFDSESAALSHLLNQLKKTYIE